MKRNGLFATMLIFATSAVLFTGCSKVKETGQSLLALLGGGGKDVPSYSQEVGPAGGTVTDPRGAVIIIPAGALTETTTITVKTYTNKNDVRDRFGIPVFSAGVELLPDGLTFAKPVTVTLPTGQAMTPGEKRTIVQYHGIKYSFRETDLHATVDAGGQTMSFQTTHFCALLTSSVLFVLADTFVYFLEASGENTATAFGWLVDWFTGCTHWMGTSIEDKDKDQVWTVKGIYFDVLWSKKTPTGPVKEGEMTECQGVCNVPERTPLNVNIFSDDKDYMSSDGETQYIYSVKINVHFKVTKEPEAGALFIGIVDPLSNRTVSGSREIGIGTVLQDEDDPITRVEYYLDGTKFHEDTIAPFTCTWDTTTTTDGEHILTAKAYDSQSREATSEPVTVAVANNTMPAGVSFDDTDYLRNKLGGDIVIGKAPTETGITNYVLCWGAANGVRLADAAPIATLPPTGSDLTYTLDVNTDLPEGAKTIVVYIDSGTETRNSNVNCVLVDYIDDPPVPGGGGALRVVREGNSVFLRWEKGSDDILKQSMLGYEVKLSGSPNISTIEEFETNGISLTEEINITEMDITSFLPNGAHCYFNIAVSDWTQISVYTMVEVTNTMVGNLSFTDSDTDAGELGGNIGFDACPNETLIADYVIYWGSDSDTKASEAPIATLPAAGLSSYTHAIPENTPRPSSAVCILVYTANSSGNENLFPASCAIRDNGMMGILLPTYPIDTSVNPPFLDGLMEGEFNVRLPYSISGSTITRYFEYPSDVASIYYNQCSVLHPDGTVENTYWNNQTRFLKSSGSFGTFVGTFIYQHEYDGSGLMTASITINEDKTFSYVNETGTETTGTCDWGGDSSSAWINCTGVGFSNVDVGWSTNGRMWGVRR